MHQRSFALAMTLHQFDAESAITDVQLKVGSVGAAYSNAVPPSRVVSQDPVAGAIVIPSTAVDFILSRGPESLRGPEFSIDVRLTPAETAEPSFRDGTPTTLAALVDEFGIQMDFVGNEIIMAVEDASVLADVLDHLSCRTR